MSWYRTGTIALVNGSTAVTGTGTAWILAAASGEGLLAPDGKVYEIDSVNSDVGITLGSPYLGATAGGQAYAIVPTQSYIRELASQAAALVNSYQGVKDGAGAGKFQDGTLAAPGIAFAGDTNTGLRRTGVDAMALVAGGVDRARVDGTGFTALVMRLRNVADTFSGLLTNAITAARTWTFPDKDGTVAMTSDITKGNVGLGNVDNTSDANKPISVSQQAALDSKVSRLDAAVISSLHFGAIVQTIVYDTGADSDGGAWRKRSQHTSWYTETLGGDRWIGQQANIAAAWAAAGSAAGAVFQATVTAGPLTAGRYYRATSSTAATEVFRGITQDFPAVAAIVAESVRVVIYDLTQVGCPMWMVFGFTGMTGTLTAIAVQNGWLHITNGNASSFGLITWQFIADVGKIWYTSGNKPSKGGLASRVDWQAAFPGNYSGASLINAAANDVAVTTLYEAPIDYVTGLPVPTIAVATAGGVSVIKDDGLVVNHIIPSYLNTNRVGFTANGVLWISVGGDHRRLGFLKAGKSTVSTSLASAFSFFTDPPASFGDFSAVNSNTFARNATSVGRDVWGGGNNGVFLLKANPAAFAKSMQAQITNLFTTGWLVGAIRGALLADTTVETIAASGEMATAGGYVVPGGSTNTISGVSASGFSSSGGAAGPRVLLVLTTVVGRTYTVTVNTSAVSSGNVQPFAKTGSDGSGSNLAIGQSIGTGYQTITFTATATASCVLWVGTVTGASFTVNGVSVKLSEPDRSIRNNGLIVNGSLTKAPVATGAELVAWSGFSASNYLEQPYNSDLDFGTGDFCLMGWVNTTSYAASQGLITRCVEGTAASLLGISLTTTTLDVHCGSATPSIASPTPPVTNTWAFVVAMRVSGVLYLHLNGAQVAAVSNTNNLTNSASVLTLGRWGYSGGFPLAGSLALWRISATAASDDQIEHIYRTELPLFQTGAQCTIEGTSTNVTAMAYDEVSELLHVGTSWGRTSFHDLRRVDSEATTTGAITSLCARDGVVLTGGNSVSVYTPAMNLRDELRRKDEARKALGKVPVFFDYTATASQTAFVAPKGFFIKAVYQNGTLRRETTTGVFWTRSTDGFRETATLSVGAAASDWISLMCVRA